MVHDNFSEKRSCSFHSALPPASEWSWLGAHELKHDGYRLQIHVRDGRVRLYTKNGADWTKRYPRIVEEAARLTRKTNQPCDGVRTKSNESVGVNSGD